MTIRDEIKWFKEHFYKVIEPELKGTPISINLVSAIAFQETGELWSKMRRTLPVEEVLRLSVGDTLDEPNRSAFPKNKAALVAVQNGQQMFELAHQLLIEMGDATDIEAYRDLGEKPNKFVHGYGIFQYDLQHFRHDPDFFLNQKWIDINNCVEKLMIELKKALENLGLSERNSLTDRQSAFVAIIYNTGFGNFKESRGLQQGHFDGRHFYGENIDRFLQIAKTISVSTRAEDDAVDFVEPNDDAARSIVAIAKAEFDRYNGIDEGRQPLRGRIADYYEAGGGSRNLDPTRNENAWSAAFVSFCVKQSGATAAQFKFSLAHSVFVHAAIANAEADRGVFRAYRINAYAPKLGDLIHHNRSGGTLSYDDARTRTQYPSHSAIVVDFDVRHGIRRAVTIGGNEFIEDGSGTVGRKFFPLRSNGMLDQSEINPKLICVVKNLMFTGGDAHEMTLGAYIVNVRTDLKLRGGPGVQFDVIDSLNDGTRLNVLEFTGEEGNDRWALVDLQGDGIKDGYVFAKFIDPIIS